MSRNNSKTIINRLPADGVLCDEHASVTWAEVRNILAGLDAFFRTRTIAACHCLYVPVQNNVSYTIILLYLLAKRVNFFLFSPNTTAGNGIPGFCDKLLRVTERLTKSNIPASLELEDNPGFKLSGSTVKPRSGAVFFASSGTTGTPKYIYFKADKLLSNAGNCVDRFQLDTTSKVLVPVPVSHMYGLGVGLLPALIAGANICLVEKNNVVKLYDRMNRFLPGIILVTPAVCRMMLLLNKKITQLATFITAGERIKPETHAAFELLYGPLINLYGCTELGAVATSLVNGSRDERIYGGVTPVGGVEMKIENGNRGEILCRHRAAFEWYVDQYGHKCANQYIKRSWYKTKDWGETNTRNAFNVIGRIDNCVNRSGFLVSLDEVESLLEQLFNEINQAVVLQTRADTLRGAGIISVCELKNGVLLNSETVKATCREKMPGHLIPDEFYFIAEMPRLHNGKPDRHLLNNRYSTTNN